MKSRLKVNKSKRSSKLAGKKMKNVRKSRRITSKKSKLLNIIKGGSGRGSGRNSSTGRGTGAQSEVSRPDGIKYILMSKNPGTEVSFRPIYAYKYDSSKSEECLRMALIEDMFGKAKKKFSGKKYPYSILVKVVIDKGGVRTNNIYIANYEPIPTDTKNCLDKIENREWNSIVKDVRDSGSQYYNPYYYIGDEPQEAPSMNNTSAFPARPGNSNRKPPKVSKKSNRNFLGAALRGEEEEKRLKAAAEKARAKKAAEAKKKAEEAAERLRMENERAKRGEVVSHGEVEGISSNEYFKMLLRKPNVLSTSKSGAIKKFGLKKDDRKFKPVVQQLVYNKTKAEGRKLFNNFITEGSNYYTWNHLNHLLSTLRSFKDPREILKNCQIREYFYSYDPISNKIELTFYTEGYVPYIDNNITSAIKDAGDNLKVIVIKYSAIISSFNKLLKREIIEDILNNEDYVSIYQFKDLEQFLNNGEPVLNNKPVNNINDIVFIKFMLNFVAFDIVLKVLNLYRPRSIEIEFEKKQDMQNLFNNSSVFRNIEYLNDQLHNHIGLVNKPYVKNLRNISGSTIPAKFEFLRGPYDWTTLTHDRSVYDKDKGVLKKNEDLKKLEGNITIRIFCNIRPRLTFNKLNLQFKNLIADIYRKYSTQLTEETLNQIRRYLGTIDEMEFTFDLSEILELANNIKIYDYIFMKIGGSETNIAKNLNYRHFRIDREHNETMYDDLNKKIKIINIFKSKVFGKEKYRHDLPINFYDPIIDLLMYLNRMITHSSIYTNNNSFNFINNQETLGSSQSILRTIIDLKPSFRDIQTSSIKKKFSSLLDYKKKDILDILGRIYYFLKIFNNIKNGIENVLLKDPIITIKISENIKKCMELFGITEDKINTITLEQLKEIRRPLLLEHHPDRQTGEESDIIRNINKSFVDLESFIELRDVSGITSELKVYPVDYPYYRYKDFNLLNVTNKIQQSAITEGKKSNREVNSSREVVAVTENMIQKMDNVLKMNSNRYKDEIIVLLSAVRKNSKINSFIEGNTNNINKHLSDILQMDIVFHNHIKKCDYIIYLLSEFYDKKLNDTDKSQIKDDFINLLKYIHNYKVFLTKEQTLRPQRGEVNIRLDGFNFNTKIIRSKRHGIYKEMENSIEEEAKAQAAQKPKEAEVAEAPKAEAEEANAGDGWDGW